MGIFASYITRVVPLPFDAPHEVTIQKLSGKALAAARQAKSVESIDYVKRMGGAAFGRELASAREAIGAAEPSPDRTRDYDRPTVLAKGVKAWTYSEAVTPATLDDLDEQATDFLFHAILDLTLPNGDAEKKTGS